MGEEIQGQDPGILTLEKIQGLDPGLCLLWIPTLKLKAFNNLKFYYSKAKSVLKSDPSTCSFPYLDPNLLNY